MRVLIDTSHASRGPTGSGVYVRELLAALRERDGVEVVEARQRLRLRPGRAGGALAPLRTAANVALDSLWLHGGLPRAARAARADVVHHPLPAHSRMIAAPQVATVHDVAFLALPDRYGRAWRLYARRTYRRAVRRCAAVVCPSQATAIEVMGLLRGHPAKLVVAHHGPGQSGAGGPDRGDPPEGGPLLFVGDCEARKNLDGLLAAYAAYRASADTQGGTSEPAPLVLAGAGAAAADGQPGVEARAALPAACSPTRSGWPATASARWSAPSSTPGTRWSRPTSSFCWRCRTPTGTARCRWSASMRSSGPRRRRARAPACRM